MSVFKKLVGFLFEEEEEIEEEGELEEVTFRQTPKPKASVRVEEEVPALKRAPAKEKVRVESVAPRQQVAPQPKPQVAPQEETKFTTIEISAPQEKPQVTKRGSTRDNSGQRAVKRSEPVKQEFEFTPVISPIFGADEKEVKHAKQANTSVPQLRTTVSSSPKKNPLGTILSPMYGATELEAFEEEAKQRIEQEQESVTAYEPPLAEAMTFDDEANEDEEIITVPLEELLSNEEGTEPNDDLLQFSLFGDDEIVSTEKSEDTYTIKE